MHAVLRRRACAETRANGASASATATFGFSTSAIVAAHSVLDRDYHRRRDSALDRDCWLGAASPGAVRCGARQALSNLRRVFWNANSIADFGRMRYHARLAAAPLRVCRNAPSGAPRGHNYLPPAGRQARSARQPASPPPRAAARHHEQAKGPPQGHHPRRQRVSCAAAGAAISRARERVWRHGPPDDGMARCGVARASRGAARPRPRVRMS